MENTGALINLDRPEVVELAVNGDSPHAVDQPPTPPNDSGGHRKKHYYMELVLETGDWTDGWACGRCEDAELIAGDILLCLGVEAHTEEEALTKAVTAARTAIRNASNATLRWEPNQLKLLAGDVHRRKELLQDRQPPVPWTLLSPAELKRYRSDERYQETEFPRWSSSDVNGAETWAVTVRHQKGSPNDANNPPRLSMLGCWLSAST